MPTNDPPVDNNRGLPYTHNPDEFGTSSGKIILEYRLLSGTGSDLLKRVSMTGTPPEVGQTVVLKKDFEAESKQYVIVLMPNQRVRGATHLGNDPELLVFVEEL